VHDADRAGRRRLRRDAVPAGGDGAVRIADAGPASDKIIRSFGDLVELLEAELRDSQLRSDVRLAG
jgi:hypothetical protein